MLKVVLGYDRKEASAVWVLANSILKNASVPIHFTFLHLPSLTKANLMWRERDPKQSTDFTYSRFLTPYLCDYKGKAIFMDADMVVMPGADIAELLDYLPMDCDLAVVKHDYKPPSKTKFGGAKQEAYKCKLWSSLMVFNCYTSKCKQLTPLYVNTATGAELHQFAWSHPSRIAEIPEEWNWIPEHSPGDLQPKLIHFTEGSPSWKAYKDCPNAETWWAEYKEACAVEVE